MANHRRESRPDSSSPRVRPRREGEHGEREKRRSRDPTAEGERRKRRRRRPVSGETPRRARRTELEPGPEPEGSETGGQQEIPESQRSSNVLSIDSLAKLDALNEKTRYLYREPVRDTEREMEKEKRRKEKVVTGRVMKERGKHSRRREDEDRKEKKRRVVSGPLAEEGKVGRRRGGYIGSLSEDDDDGRKRRKLWLAIGSIVLLLAIFIPVGIVVSKKKGGDGSGASDGGATQGSDPSNSNLGSISENDIPTSAKGSVLDPFTWYDTTDFNVTFTNDTVGGLSIMGLNSTWNDTAQANPYVPALDKSWMYGTMPIRGVNLGGWLSIEPFITPSLFNSYEENEGIVDEYTLSKELGPSQAAKVLEKHYALFMTEQTFIDVRAAGFDHVRIPFSYWAVTTYPGDPYVPKISWRYLLRGIEYARKYGLRVNLDVHALPGSQNGWNHSGRQGNIGWLNGNDGALNGQRSLDLHAQLSTFFAQPRYKNLIAIYGLANEPRMSKLSVDDVTAWTTSAVAIVRKNGIKQPIAFGDGFLGLPKWQGKLQGIEGLVLDAHQYVIFNPDQIAFTHQKKIHFGPTLCGEWSQADTDCTTYLNNVNTGSRWLGTLQASSPADSILTPSCPKSSDAAAACSCAEANASPDQYSDPYKKWLMMNAEAQMTSFEQGWGWFYWTWITEDA
ncbi:hypothetical protein MMC29_008486, partial [Sticta canariensis]|nr:hypothetical protein [Sticta canariensis]